MINPETVKQPLSGHTTQETAYLVDDYPYGFKLRCKIRYWLEYRRGYGYRLMSQTTNPKKPIEVWNKPNSSTYMVLGCMFLDQHSHVQWSGLSMYSGLEEFTAFKDTFGSYLDTDGLRIMAAMELYHIRQSEKEITK